MSLAVQPPLPIGPQAGLDASMDRQHKALWRYLRVLGADPAAADDLVQEAFLVALRRPDFDASVPGAVFTFLRTTARHLWQRSQKRRNTEREIEEGDAVWQHHCGEGDGDAYVEALRQCCERLPPKSRALLQATYGDGQGRNASATSFGLSADGVKSALRRLRALLHDCIHRRLEENAR